MFDYFLFYWQTIITQLWLDHFNHLFLILKFTKLGKIRTCIFCKAQRVLVGGGRSHVAQGTRSTMFPLSARCALIGRLCGTLPPPQESTYRGAEQCEAVVSRSVVSVMFVERELRIAPPLQPLCLNMVSSL